ncbi:MAG TPA: MalY/PatB family protein [Sporichthyaceae bacterium]|jgi:cystathionine beta-lyase|nr:MalY/PatB family protein [Sporichthyaceae bacterium]
MNSLAGTEPAEFAFDQVDLGHLRRRHSMKWRAYPADVLPAWVAEMDFAVAPPIAEAVRESLARGGDFGYAVDLVAPELSEAFSGFAARRWGWAVDPDRVILLRDVMRGVELWIEGFTRPGDGVVVTSPVYYPFLDATRTTGRRLVEVPMVRGTGRWELDLAGLDAAFAAGNKLLLLCNPHNPVGRVYTEAELRAVAELTQRHNVRVVSDEIHAPLVLPPARHVPFASLGPEIEARTLTLHSATKAWGMAGLHTAVALVGDPADDAWLRSLTYRHRGAAGILGIDTSVAAFNQGEPWLDALLAHLGQVLDHLGKQLSERLPDVEWIPPEGTYLAWLDCRALGLEPSPQQVFLRRGKVALNDGATFGRTGAGFVRLNFGTSRAVVTETVSRMAMCVQ